MDANAIIQNFIKSMGGPGAGGQQQAQGKLFTTLQDLLTTPSTIPWVDSIDEAQADNLLQFLPSQLTALAQQADSDPMIDTPVSTEPLTLEKKKDILRRVLRSPQFTQSLASLTIALRDGGLPSLSEALNVPVRNGGYMRRGGVPLGSGEAVEAFLDGVKEKVEEEQRGDGGDQMDTQ
jgi:26S proteasome regulatory subunit N13